MRKALPIYAALSPYFFFFLVFAAIPMIFTLLLAFTDWSSLGSALFVGLENFTYLISDHLFYKSLGNTLILWAMGTIPTLIIATIVALMLNKTMARSWGKVTWKNVCHPLAPSMAAASYCVLSMACRPARMSSAL